MIRSSDSPDLPDSVPADPGAADSPAPDGGSAARDDEAPTPNDSRRRFLQASLLGAGALSAMSATNLAHAQTGALKRTFNHYHIAASDKTVHWGYFSKSLKPLVEIESGDFVT